MRVQEESGSLIQYVLTRRGDLDQESSVKMVERAAGKIQLPSECRMGEHGGDPSFSALRRNLLCGP